MSEPAAKSAGQRFPRLSIPGGLLLALCLFLPAVKGCDKPVYPVELPHICGPYVFGLLVAMLACFPRAKKVVLLRFAVWIVGTIAGAVEGLWFLSVLLRPNHKVNLPILIELLFWMPLFFLIVTSVRYRHDPERWRYQLLGSGGALSLQFFLLFLFTETSYYGLWLSILATVLLIIEGLVNLRLRARAPVA